MIIDFTDLPQNIQKSYLGANGSKKCISYNNVDYMVKFPSLHTKTTELSYVNGCTSEYLGCHIFELLNIPVQETLLGTYRIGNKEKNVVACRDMTEPGVSLIPFAGLKNQTLESQSNGFGTELDDIITTLEEQKLFDQKEIKERFWDMFIVDALIGNWDRHNGNWGYLYNSLNNTVQLAPVYDCGSSLYPQADNEIMQNVLNNEQELKSRVYSIPTSAIKQNGKRINYFDFISSLQNEDCNKALRRIYPRIDLDKINNLIDNTPFINELQKKFYKLMLKKRYELILTPAYKKMIQKECVINTDKNVLSDDVGKEYILLIQKNLQESNILEAKQKANKIFFSNKNDFEKVIYKQLLRTYYINNNIKSDNDLEKHVLQKQQNKSKTDDHDRSR